LFWCFLLYLKNKTGYQFFSSTLRSAPPRREEETLIESAMEAKARVKQRIY
jgi:hypothetical protein